MNRWTSRGSISARTCSIFSKGCLVLQNLEITILVGSLKFRTSRLQSTREQWSRLADASLLCRPGQRKGPRAPRAALLYLPAEASCNRGARDGDNHRQPDVNNRDEYRHPNVPRSQQNAYRRGFQLGYQRVMSQLMGQTRLY